MYHPHDREASWVAKARSGGRQFDRDYRVTTHAVAFLTDLDPEAVGDAGAHATHYEAVPVADFHALLALVPKDAIEASTFVDVGAGMGRGVILAAEYPFKQVLGIEVSPAFYEVAKENLVTARKRGLRCKDVRLQRDDARIAHYPPGDLVVFLFNPFDAEALRATLASIEARRDPGKTWLLYHTPVEQHVFDELPQWQPLRVAKNVAVFLRVDIQQYADRSEVGKDR
jgi:SAM-dependent methyltransferase